MEVGNEGLSRLLSNLLEQPLRVTIQPIGIITTQKKNDDLRKFCMDMRPILARYPFSPMSQMDATLSDVESGFAPVRGQVSKYLLASGSDLVGRTPQGTWQQNSALQGMKVSSELLAFLERSQQFSGALFADSGNLRPSVQYVLRSVRQNVVFHLVIDGNDKFQSRDPIQKAFDWPAPPGARQGAAGLFDEGPGGGFGQYDGLWGVFHLFQNADERPLMIPDVQWSEIRGLRGAIPQKLNQKPKVQFVKFPGGVDLFNPKFFESLQCPTRAVVPN
jgi:type VI protein secretion system component VasK